MGKKLIDETGKVYGRFTVLEYDKEKHKWKCQCECGNIRYLLGTWLRAGKYNGCGCRIGKFREENRRNLIGQKFNMLTPISWDKKKAEWICRCECGNKTYCSSDALLSGKRKSCGCINNNKYKDIRNTKEYKTLYRRYNMIKTRCYNKKAANYLYYGGKGIKMCEEWLGENGFRNFYNWAINSGFKVIEGSYNDMLSIDRIDSNKDYCPENCRWITVEQNIARSAKCTYDLEKKVIELNNETEDELVQDYIQRKMNMLENKKVTNGTFFFRKPNYCYLHNTDNTKQFLFKNYRTVAIFLNITHCAVGYRIRKKNGVVADGWRLEKINKESFDELKNKGIEVIR